jgi:hypothetical protein
MNLRENRIKFGVFLNKKFLANFGPFGLKIVIFGQNLSSIAEILTFSLLYFYGDSKKN